MKKYKVTRVSGNVAKVEDVIIEKSKTFRKVFRGMIIGKNPKDPKASLRGHIVIQRKGPNDAWKDFSSVKITELNKDEGIKLELRSLVLKNLFEALHNLYEISGKKLPWLEESYILAKEKEIIKVPKNRRRFVKKLLNKNYGDEIWRQLVAEKPDLATQFARSRIQEEREKVLKEFEESVETNKNEGYWQDFFMSNEWIFGLGLKYQYLHLITDQPDYGGGSVFGKGNQRGDYLVCTNAATKFTVLVEIKKPQTPLLGKKQYRNGAWELGKDLTGGVSQLQVSSLQWETQGSRNDENREELGDVITCRPKSLLIIGHCKNLDTGSKKKTFESFRQQLVNPNVITFDELLERTRFIVNNLFDSEKNDNEEISKEEKIPF